MQKWVVHQTNDGDLHYYNNFTKESTYHKPKDFVDSMLQYGHEVRKITSKEFLNEEWEKIKTNTNDEFYYNKNTKKSQWNPPNIQQEVKEEENKLEYFFILLLKEILKWKLLKSF